MKKRVLSSILAGVLAVIVQKQPSFYGKVLFKDDGKRERTQTLCALYAHTYSPVSLHLCRRTFRRMGHFSIYHPVCHSVLVQTCGQMAGRTSRRTEAFLSSGTARIGTLCSTASAHHSRYAWLSSFGCYVLSVTIRAVQMANRNGTQVFDFTSRRIVRLLLLASSRNAAMISG